MATKKNTKKEKKYVVKNPYTFFTRGRSKKAIQMDYSMQAKPPSPEESRINRTDWQGENKVYLEFFKKHNMPIPKKAKSSGTKKKTTKKSSGTTTKKTTKKSSGTTTKKTTKKSSGTKTTKKKTTSKKKISEPQISEPQITEKEPQVGDIIKLKSGRIDKIIKVIPEDDWHFKRYMTQELNPPAGQEPKIGKLYYRDFEIIEQNPEEKITEKITQKNVKEPKKTTTKKRETKNNIDIYSIENNDASSTKIIFNKKDLKNILPLLKIITPKNTYTFPVIFNVIDNKNCEILAQDEKITVKHIIPCNANKIIQLIIDIKNLNSIIKDLSDNILTFEILEKNKLTVNNKLSFETLPTDEFTFEFKNISGNKYNNLNFNLFADNIIKLSPFIDKKNYRANLISICLKYNKESNTIDFISTESHTLGVIAIPIKNLPITETKEMTIPSETVEIIKIINKNIKNVTNFNLIIQSEPNEPYANKMQINSNNFAVISNLIEAEYVNYPAVIPDKNKALIEYKVNSQELLRVVNECDKLVKPPYGLVKFHFKDNSLKITETNDTNLNSYSNEIQVNLIKPNKELNNEFTLGINIKLLNICLKLFNEPTLSLYDKRSAILITEENNPAYSILMPSTID